MTRCWKWD